MAGEEVLEVDNGTARERWYEGLHLPDQGVMWVRVPEDGGPLRGVVCGNPRSWRCHFVRVRERGRVYGARCLAGEAGQCRLCELGNPPRVRYVLPLWIEGVVQYVELGRAQWGDLLRVGAGGWLGKAVVLWRERPGPTGRIRLAEDVLAEPGEAPPPEVDITEFVLELGRQALQRVLTALERERSER